MSAAACPMAATFAGADTVGTALTSESPAATIAPSTIERIASSLNRHGANLSDRDAVAITIRYDHRRNTPWRAGANASGERCASDNRRSSRAANPSRAVISRARKQTKVARLTHVLFRNLSSAAVVVYRRRAGRGWSGIPADERKGATVRSPSCTDLLVKRRISLILRGGIPFRFAGGTPCDFFDPLYASPPLPLSWFWSSLSPSRWREIMGSGRTRLRTCEGGFKG
jgi:hypothetical protein